MNGMVSIVQAATIAVLGVLGTLFAGRRASDRYGGDGAAGPVSIASVVGAALLALVGIGLLLWAVPAFAT